MRRSRPIPVMVVAALLIAAFAVPAQPAATVSALETKDLAILGTSDLHGNVQNYDYFTDSEPTNSSSERGLTKIQTYVKGVLGSNPNTILIDNGDTIQGNPLAYYFNMVDTSKENPLAAAMNEMEYVASTVGNHEFNYGPSVFNKYQSEANFPLLSANVTGCRDYTFVPYVIKDVGGVQVGILGLTPPAVKYWERPENIVDCVFGDAMAAANTYVPQMRTAGADVIVVAAHSGLDETYGYGREENFVKYLANEVPGIDVILAGHAHAKVPGETINGVLVTEPYYWGRSVSDIRITVSGTGSDWTVTSKSSTTPDMRGVAEDADLLTLMKPYHDTTVAYINTPIGTATDDFPGGFPARVADGPMADLINYVQTDAAEKAGFPVEASLAALFNDSAKLSAGPIKLKDAYAVYIYDNTLYVIEASGQMIKDELEWTANYFNQYYYEPTGVTVNSAVRDYNYDLWSGIEYELDVTKPVGERVVELKLNGKPLAMDQMVRVALNNYRATGKFPTAEKLYQSTTEVRELITNWIMDKETISPSDVYVHNFDLLPPVNTWQSGTASDPVTRADYGELLWTAFDDSSSDVKVPDQKKDSVQLSRQGGLFLLADSAKWDLSPDMSVLKPYSDARTLLGWAKQPTAYALKASIFTPEGNQLLPRQTLTNAEALAWVRETRYATIQILSLNDFHGNLEPPSGSGGRIGTTLAGGAEYLATHVNALRATNPNTLFVSAGDMIGATPLVSALFHDEPTIEAFNQMGLDFNGVGNHEFDEGVDELLRMQNGGCHPVDGCQDGDGFAGASFEYLAANVVYKDSGKTIFPPFAIRDFNGVSVALVGMTLEGTPSIVSPAGISHVDFLDEAESVNALVPVLKGMGIETIIVLLHEGGRNSDPLNETTINSCGTLTGALPPIVEAMDDEIDVVITGHTNWAVNCVVDGKIVTGAAHQGRLVTDIDLTVSRVTKDVASAKVNNVIVTRDVAADEDITALITKYKTLSAPLANKVIGSITETITRTANLAGESALGDVIADAQLWATTPDELGGADIALMNAGGIRAELTYDQISGGELPGEVTYSEAFTVQPFGNSLVTMTLTGAQVDALLEQQFTGGIGILQVSHTLTYDRLATAGPDGIVTNVRIAGVPLDPAASYRVTVNNFLADGGDNYTVLKEGTDRLGGDVDVDAFTKYVEAHSPVAPGPQDRITLVP